MPRPLPPHFRAQGVGTGSQFSTLATFPLSSRAQHLSNGNLQIMRTRSVQVPSARFLFAGFPAIFGLSRTKPLVGTAVVAAAARFGDGVRLELVGLAVQQHLLESLVEVPHRIR